MQPPPPVEFDPADLLSIAARLKVDVGWVREKVRSRCRRPLPCYNVGRHLLFDWKQISEWIRSTPRPKHSPHARRKEQTKA